MSKSEDIRNLLSSAGVTDEAQVNEIVNKANEVEQTRAQQEENLKKDPLSAGSPKRFVLSMKIKLIS